MNLTRVCARVLMIVSAIAILEAPAAFLGAPAPASANDGLPTKDAVSDMTGSEAGQIRTDNVLPTKLVWIPAGRFTMGSRPNEADHKEDEAPVEVRMTQGFWMGQHEVTQAEWKRVMRTTPWSGKFAVKEGDDYPVTFVGWADAMNFCKRLTAAEHNADKLPVGWKYSLPTEAQWEYACRAGTTTRFSFGDDAAALVDHGWFDKNTTDAGTTAAPRLPRRRVVNNGERYAHRVAQKSANPWGLFDMHGNVSEWCRDTYLKDMPGGDDPEVSTPNILHMIRGGNWVLGSQFCRSANRDWDERDDRTNSLGFRLVLVRSAN